MKRIENMSQEKLIPDKEQEDDVLLSKIGTQNVFTFKLKHFKMNKMTKKGAIKSTKKKKAIDKD